MDSGANVRADVLKVGHHGSPTSSSEAFLEAVAPSIAVISVGKDNDYGHPSADVLARLEALGTTIYRTDTQGEIIITSDGQTLTVTTDPTSREPAAGVHRQPQFHDRPQRQLRQAPRRGQPRLLQHRRGSRGIRLPEAHLHQIGGSGADTKKPASRKIRRRRSMRARSVAARINS